MHTPPPLPNSKVDYASPPTQQSRPITSIRQTITLGAISAILFGELMYVAPRMEQLYRDFKADLPMLTKLTISASHFVQSNILAWPLFLAIPLFAPMITTALIWRSDLTPMQFRVRRYVLGSLITTLFALAAVMVAIGMFVGYFSIIDSVSTMKK